ncbi:FHA domain-containing protein [Lentzea sp. NPDC059081]|uniref:FHA domain-containing protein n=1 Tax=Lentzea sp. NPDC059081 TaxID=3346719 RepID=UPI00369CFC10
MTAVEYVPGTWVAVVGESTWLLLAVAPETELVRRCWELVRSDQPLDEVIAAIMDEGFRAVSGFALVRFAAGEKRAVVRGGARLQVMREAGDVEEISAAGVGTWVDRNLEDVARLRVAIGSGGSSLPVHAGVVLASELVVTLTDVPVSLPQPAEPVVAVPDVVVPEVVVPAPPPEVVEHTVVVQEEPVREQAPPPVPQVTQMTGVIQSFDWAPQPAAPAPAWAEPEPEPVTQTVLRSNASPNDTRMLHAGRTGGARLARAKRCPAGHLSSDYAVHCRVCEVPLPHQDAAMLAMPVLGLLRLSNGDTIALDRDVVMGRDPSGDVRGANLVQVGRENDTDISRTHVDVRLSGWDVLVRDLGSTNGTTVSRPGCPPEKLAPHIEQFLTPGTRVTLGDQVYFTFEVTG